MPFREIALEALSWTDKNKYRFVSLWLKKQKTLHAIKWAIIVIQWIK